MESSSDPRQASSHQPLGTSTAPNLLVVPSKFPPSADYDRARELIRGPKLPLIAGPPPVKAKSAMVSQPSEPLSSGPSELDSHARPDRLCSRERTWRSFDRSRVRDRRLCRAERRRVRWNDLRQLRERNQDGWSSIVGEGEKDPRGVSCYHSCVPRRSCEEGLGSSPWRKLELDKTCLRGGSRSLRPFQKSQTLHLHDRRRPRRGARREPRKATGNALSNLHRVRKRREGPESRHSLSAGPS